MSIEDSFLDEVDISSFCIIGAPDSYKKTSTQIFFPPHGRNSERIPENNVENIRPKEFLNILTDHSSTGNYEHVIMNSLEDIENGTNLRQGDLVMELDDEPAQSFSHEEIVQHFNNIVRQDHLTIEIKLKIQRREHGLPVLIICVIRLEYGVLDYCSMDWGNFVKHSSMHVQSDYSILPGIINGRKRTGTWHFRIENLSIEYPYMSKSKNTCRFETYNGKFLKTSDKSIDIQVIDYPTDIQYNFEYIQYVVGPNESSTYDYMFCLRVLIDKEYYYLCPDESDGVRLEKRPEIEDKGWKVRYDDRFYFRKDNSDDNFVEKGLHSGIYLSCNESDELEFKVTVCVPWSDEARRAGASKEFQFHIIMI